MLPEELGEENKKIKISDGDEENVSGLGAPEKTKPGVIPESKTRFTPDLFLKREQLLFKKWDYKQISGKKNITIGLSRALEFWDSMPFWSTFFRALGYDVIMSYKSSRAMFEDGLSFVPSDTVCFPAKLATDTSTTWFIRQKN